MRKSAALKISFYKHNRKYNESYWNSNMLVFLDRTTFATLIPNWYLVESKKYILYYLLKDNFTILDSAVGF